VTGAVAANAYMPPRQTADLDFAVQTADLGTAGLARPSPRPRTMSASAVWPP
jgi:hypothetical protein